MVALSAQQAGDQTEQVLVTKARQKKAPKYKAHENATQKKSGAQKNSGAETGERKSSATLGIAILGIKRLPKPRSSPSIDELVWGKAQITAQEQLTAELKPRKSWEEYSL